MYIKNLNSNFFYFPFSKKKIMNSLNDAIQRSTTDIPVVATANSNTRSHVLGPVPRRNALTGDVENIKTRLVGFEAAFDTMEARLNLLTAQQEAPMPTSGKYIGNNPEMSVCSQLANNIYKQKKNNVYHFK